MRSFDVAAAMNATVVKLLQPCARRRRTGIRPNTVYG